MPSSCSCKTFHFVDVHVGARLRERRQWLGVRIQQLAAATGVSFQQSQKYECAQNCISPSRLYSFACALAVPVGWFFDGLRPIKTDPAWSEIAGFVPLPCSRRSISSVHQASA